jgi:hypothetical protein
MGKKEKTILQRKDRKMEKRGKAEKGKGEITKHEITKKSIRKGVKIKGHVQGRIWSNSCYIFSNSAWFIYVLFHPEEASNAFFEMLIICSDQKMIPARNAINADAQIFLVNDELLLPIQKTSGKCSR